MAVDGNKSYMEERLCGRAEGKRQEVLKFSSDETRMEEAKEGTGSQCVFQSSMMAMQCLVKKTFLSHQRATLGDGLAGMTEWG